MAFNQTPSFYGEKGRSVAWDEQEFPLSRLKKQVFMHLMRREWESRIWIPYYIIVVNLLFFSLFYFNLSYFIIYCFVFCFCCSTFYSIVHYLILFLFYFVLFQFILHYFFIQSMLCYLSSAQLRLSYFIKLSSTLIMPIRKWIQCIKKEKCINTGL